MDNSVQSCENGFCASIILCARCRERDRGCDDGLGLISVRRRTSHIYIGGLLAAGAVCVCSDVRPYTDIL